MLCGCSLVFQNFDYGEHKDKVLTYGMSKEEVLAKIGEPQKMSTMGIDGQIYEVWEYADDNPSLDDKIRPLGIIYSKVFFLDGKLMQRDKDRVYSQPSFEFLESVNARSGVENNNVTGKNTLEQYK